MKIKEIKIIRSVLSKEIGCLWPIFFVKCLTRKNTIFKKTHWAKEKSDESKFLKHLSLIVVCYTELKAKFGKEEAFEIMKNILVPIGFNRVLEQFQTLKTSREDPMKLLIAHFNLIDTKGAGRFCIRKITQINGECHRIVTKCPFYDFFVEAGTPELTKLFCEVDKEFYSRAFPEFEFHRNGSWENTIAYGKDHCEFVFERKDLKFNGEI